MTRTCPSCQQPVTGRFCSSCGVAVDAECRECGNPLPAGARFCNQCGAPVAASAAGSAPSAPWIRWAPWAVAGVAVAALAGVLLLGGDDPEPRPTAPVAAAPLDGTSGSASSGSALSGPAGGPARGPAGNPGAVDLSSMTPREAADRLFNRVMQSASAGDTAQARSFLPMAIAAYGRVPELDTDGHYHLAVLHLVGGDTQAARAEANAILARDPQHLFGLFTAAQAERAMGNQARARELFQRFLDAYDTESQRELPEYRDHAQALGPMRQEAERAVGGA
ncbi:MAG TPA: zinc ribbon domain-containing protein [Longimicrobiaceae bacterium]|nr:zinc ribbon domain-containing protein [Longimicrobiaceae bacterium]